MWYLRWSEAATSPLPCQLHTASKLSAKRIADAQLTRLHARMRATATSPANVHFKFIAISLPTISAQNGWTFQEEEIIIVSLYLERDWGKRRYSSDRDRSFTRILMRDDMPLIPQQRYFGHASTCAATFLRFRAYFASPLFSFYFWYW